MRPPAHPAAKQALRELLRRAVPYLLVAGLELAATSARAQAVMVVENFTATSHTWDGQGDVLLTSSGCIRASDNGSPHTYSVRADQSGWIPGSGFQLTSTGWPISRVPLAVDFDSAPPTAQLSLPRGGPYSGAYPGATTAGCSNAQLRWYFRASDLGQVPAGTYTDGTIFGLFPSITLYAAWSDDESRNASTAPRVRMTVPPLVRISDLQDIVVQHDGVSPSVTLGSTAYCVWSNTGSYTLTASSATSHPPLPASFAVASGGNTIPYTVRIAGGTDPAQGTAVANGGTVGPLAGNGQAQDCGGSDNASLQVAFNGTDILGSPAGIYSATLVLRVEPD